MPKTSLPGGARAVSTNTTANASDSLIEFNAASGALIGTFPDAASVPADRILTFIKTDSTSNGVTINTTSSQLVGIRASGDIVLGRQGDRISVRPNGSNWVIVDKLETKVLTAFDGLGVGPTDGAYLASAATLTLGPGRWRVTAAWNMNQGTGTGVTIQNTSGLFSANGTGTTSTPTALSAAANLKQIEGNVDMQNFATTYVFGGGTNATNVRTSGGQLTATLTIAGGTVPVFAVPRVSVGSAGSASVSINLVAERLD